LPGSEQGSQKEKIGSELTRKKTSPPPNRGKEEKGTAPKEEYPLARQEAATWDSKTKKSGNRGKKKLVAGGIRRNHRRQGKWGGHKNLSLQKKNKGMVKEEEEEKENYLRRETRLAIQLFEAGKKKRSKRVGSARYEGGDK